MFPYGVLVDAQGRVAGHGSLSEILEKFDADALIAPSKPDSKRARQNEMRFEN